MQEEEKRKYELGASARRKIDGHEMKNKCCRELQKEQIAIGEEIVK